MWTKFPNNFGFNNGPVAIKSGMTKGFSRDSFALTVEHIKASKLVRHEPRYFALPQMAVECKAREKSLREAEVRAGYVGIAIVYGKN